MGVDDTLLQANSDEEITLVEPEVATARSRKNTPQTQALRDCWKEINTVLGDASSSLDAENTSMDNTNESCIEFFERSIITATDSSSDACVSLTAMDFVKFFSSYNVISNSRVPGGKEPPLSAFEGVVEVDNTKDPPTCLLFRCLDCLWETLLAPRYQQHLLTCELRERPDDALPASPPPARGLIKRHPCPHADKPNVSCDKMFRKPSDAIRHGLQHEFVKDGHCPRRDECGSNVLFHRLVDFGDPLFRVTFRRLYARSYLSDRWLQ